MKAFLAGVALLACGLVAASDESTTAAASSNVPMLTKDSFDKYIEEHELALVKFMAPWCGHCKKMAPAYEEAAGELKASNSPVGMAEVDATQEQELATKFEVRGFPTLLWFRKGVHEAYTGGRSKDDLLGWIAKMSGPAVSTCASLDECHTLCDTASVCYLASAGSKAPSATTDIFNTVADAHRVKGKFVLFNNANDSKDVTVQVIRKAEASEKIKMPSIVLKDEEGLKQFVDEEALPFFGPISGENYAQYAARSSNWVWFAGDKAAYEQHAEALRKASMSNRKEFNFVWLDSEAFKAHAENALGLKEFPSVAVVWEEGKYHYTNKEDMAGLGKFLESVRAGKVQRFIKSEPIPEKNDEAVKVVVGKNFSDMVLDSNKDVMLMIYAPWCGHCKKLEPVYEDFAKRTAGSKNFMVAKLDGTSNEPDVSGFDFKGFPSLFFVKAGESKPITFEGERTLEGLVEFVKKEAKFPIVYDAPESSDDNDRDEL